VLQCTILVQQQLSGSLRPAFLEQTAFVGPLFLGAPVQPNMLNISKSALESRFRTVLVKQRRCDERCTGDVDSLLTTLLLQSFDVAAAAADAAAILVVNAFLLVCRLQLQ